MTYGAPCTIDVGVKFKHSAEDIMQLSIGKIPVMVKVCFLVLYCACFVLQLPSNFHLIPFDSFYTFLNTMFTLALLYSTFLYICSILRLCDIILIYPSSPFLGYLVKNMQFVWVHAGR